MSATQVVRQRLRVREPSSRTFDHRLLLRLPWLADASSRLLAALPPRSRIHQAIIGRAVRLATEAFNSRDLDAFKLNRVPDWEAYPAREMVETGLVERCYRGPAAFRELVSSYAEIWAGDIRMTEVEILDLCCLQT